MKVFIAVTSKSAEKTPCLVWPSTLSSHESELVLVDIWPEIKIFCYSFHRTRLVSECIISVGGDAVESEVSRICLSGRTRILFAQKWESKS